MTPEIQKILGSHANGKAETKNLYNKHALTWPVNVLGAVIQEIKQGYNPDDRQKHLQLKPEVYRSALPGGNVNNDSYLKQLAKFEEEQEGKTPTYLHETGLERIKNHFLPPLEFMQGIRPNATPDTDERLEIPILESFENEAEAKGEALEEEGDSEDSQEQEKSDSEAECMVNIAAETGNIW